MTALAGAVGVASEKDPRPDPGGGSPARRITRDIQEKNLTASRPCARKGNSRERIFARIARATIEHFVSQRMEMLWLSRRLDLPCGGHRRAFQPQDFFMEEDRG